MNLEPAVVTTWAAVVLLVLGPPFLLLVLRAVLARWVDPGERTSDTNPHREGDR